MIEKFIRRPGPMRYFILKVRDGTKPKNSKPIEIHYWDSGQTDNVIAGITEVLQWKPSAKLRALKAITIEARPMTVAEADKWDRQVDREARRAERMNG